LYSTAINGLSGLYQLHCCEWAKDELTRLRSNDDCPELFIGHTPDGRLGLRVEPLKLLNPAFQDYTVLLCTMQSNSALALAAENPAMLTVIRSDGSELSAELINFEHPLYENLKRLERTFVPVQTVPSGTGQSFKQVFPIQSFSQEGILAVLLNWNSYRIYIPYQ
jgi:hypothetical protein